MLKLKLQYFGHLMWKAYSLEKTDGGRDWGQEEKGETEDEMVGWQYQLNGHEFEQTPGDSKGQGSLACYSPWGHKESDTTEWRTTSLTLSVLIPPPPPHSWLFLKHPRHAPASGPFHRLFCPCGFLPEKSYSLSSFKSLLKFHFLSDVYPVYPIEYGNHPLPEFPTFFTQIFSPPVAIF